MNGRLYDPVVGRFFNADPYIQNPGFTQNYNRYSYCLNNPLKYTDLSGNQMTAYKYFMQNVFGESGGRGFDGYKGSDGLGGGGVDSGYYGSAGPTASGLSTTDMINYLWYRGDVAGFWTSSTGFVFTHDGAFPGSKNGVQGIWYQSVSLEGHYQNWQDGVNSPDAYVNVSNTFIASKIPGSQDYSSLEIGFKINDIADKAGTLTSANIYGAQRLAGIAVKEMAKLTALTVIGRVTGVTCIVDNSIKFWENPRDNWWNGVLAVGQTTAITVGWLTGVEEIELIYNATTLTIDLTIMGINKYNRNHQ